MALTRIGGDLLQKPVNIGTGVTISSSGDATFSGVVTATTFTGSFSGQSSTSIYAATAGIATVATLAQGLTGTPSIVVGIATASTLSVSGSLSGDAFESYELDDLSSATNDHENTFTPKFNYETVTITNPFKLMITVNGIIQSAFINNTDSVYQSHFLGSNNGYTIDYDNNIKFTESIPTGSEIVARVLPVSNTATKTRLYPFKPTDILLGY